MPIGKKEKRVVSLDCDNTQEAAHLILGKIVYGVGTPHMAHIAQKRQIEQLRVEVREPFPNSDGAWYKV